MARPVHPDKDVESAVAYAESMGWRYEPPNGHPWGRLYCPGERPRDCILSVWSTPKDVYAHARQIRRRVNACAPYGSAP
jgi:hypothetical protein